jgi:hypothetical protein
LVMFSIILQEAARRSNKMEKYDLANLTIVMLGLLIEMFKRKLISYELFKKNTRIKVDFLRYFVEGPVAEDMVEKIRHILSQYHNCLLIGYSSAYSTPLSEDQFPC